MIPAKRGLQAFAFHLRSKAHKNLVGGHGEAARTQMEASAEHGASASVSLVAGAS